MSTFVSLNLYMAVYILHAYVHMRIYTNRHILGGCDCAFLYIYLYIYIYGRSFEDLHSITSCFFGFFLPHQSLESVASQHTRRNCPAGSSPSSSPPLRSRPSSSHADEVAKAMEELEKSLAEMRESLQWRDDQVKGDVREMRSF